MSTKTIVASTANTLGGFAIGAFLVSRGCVATGLTVIVLGFITGVVFAGRK